MFDAGIGIDYQQKFSVDESGELEFIKEFSSGTNLSVWDIILSEPLSVTVPYDWESGEFLYDEAIWEFSSSPLQENRIITTINLGPIRTNVGLDIDEAIEFGEEVEDNLGSAFSRFWNQLEYYFTDPSSPFWGN